MRIAVNPAVEQLHAYVPGEQPREPGFVKLNTNESPYPPSPEVIEAVHRTATDALYNKYPDPLSTELRRAISADLGLGHGNVLIGNGSDEVLRLLCHAFLRPGDSIGMLNPTYVLYETLAAMFGAGAQVFNIVQPDYLLPDDCFTAAVKIFFLPNPNPPIGTFYPLDQVRMLAEADPSRLVVVDEAYVDFAPGSSVELLRDYANLVITRTFSKSYSLAGLRAGFVLGAETLIEQMNKIRDSYNVNRVTQAGALAAWQSKDYYRKFAEQIKADREFLRAELINRGFQVPESHGNFVFARHTRAADLYKDLKARKVLVRYFSSPALADGVRITIGTRLELEKLLTELDALLR